MNINLFIKIIKLIIFITNSLIYLTIFFIHYESANDAIVLTYIVLFSVLIFLSIKVEKILTLFPYLRTCIKLGITIIILAVLGLGNKIVSLRSLLCLINLLLGILSIIIGLKNRNKNNDNNNNTNSNITNNDNNNKETNINNKQNNIPKIEKDINTIKIEEIKIKENNKSDPIY